MSQAAQELVAVVFAVVLFAAATSLAVRAGSRAGALVSLMAFLSFSLLAAWVLWRLP